MKNDLEALFDEVRLTWHGLVRAGERLHADEPTTVGMRAVLERLLLRGAATVPAIARDRRVTRQHVQILVNALAKKNLVELVPNAAHKRSSLVSLTGSGKRLIKRMKKREHHLVAGLSVETTPAAVARATATLRAVRNALEIGGEP